MIISCVQFQDILGITKEFWIEIITNNSIVSVTKSIGYYTWTYLYLYSLSINLSSENP